MAGRVLAHESATSNAQYTARHPGRASRKTVVAEGSRLQLSLAETRQVRLPQLRIVSYPQSYPYWAQRQSNIDRNALMAKGRRAVSRQNSPKVALTGSVAFGTRPVSRDDARMRSDERVNYVKFCH